MPLYNASKKPKTSFNFAKSQENIFGTTILWAQIFYERLVTKEIKRKIKVEFRGTFPQNLPMQYVK